MKPVDDRYKYWQEPPPEPSPQLLKWVKKIQDGWTPNRRWRQYGYDSSAQMFGVYIWEYLRVIAPLLYNDCRPSGPLPEWAAKILTAGVEASQ
jgi:hypothetical protein